MQHRELTHDIIGCAMKIHNTLGNGFQEVIYQRCLELEFKKTNLFYWREQEMEIFYDNVQVGTRRADFIIEKDILLEIKAVIQLKDVHLAQALNYLEAYDLETGLLVNFGSKSLQFKRLFNNKYQNQD
jgi:GxxExxY protein